MKIGPIVKNKLNVNTEVRYVAALFFTWCGLHCGQSTDEACRV